MSRTCEICGKGPAMGRRLVYRGLAKRKGGIGKKITGITKRRFLPNLQKIKVLYNGSVRRMRVCTSCIRSGRVQKVPARPPDEEIKAARRGGSIEAPSQAQPETPADQAAP